VSADPADPTAIRLGLLNEGYQPTPICPPGCTHVDKRGRPCKSAGKAVHIAGWTKGTATARDVRAWHRTRPQDTNTGLLTGEMVGVDGDILDPLLSAQVDNLAEQHFGPTPLRRIGRAPKWLRCYRSETPMPKLETPERRLNGEIIQVEIMGKGQQVAAYGTHPTTMQPYTWIDQEPLNLPLAELPVVTEAQLRAFLAAADALFVAAGAELSVPPKAAPSGPHVNGHAAAGANGATAGGNFFHNVNKAALANISPWFKAIFPKAIQESGTGAWRVSSADLGRSLEEDLSMHPTEGGQDFGKRESLSPITTAIDWGGAPDAKAAAHWLCEQLGKKPADLGWKAADHANGADKSPPNGKDDTASHSKPRAKPKQETDDDLITEGAVADAFTRAHRDRLRYCHDTGAWFHWNGVIWRHERTELAFLWAHQRAQALAADSDNAKVVVTAGRASFAVGVERLAQADRAFAVTSETWDADPWLLATPGGTVELRTGELRPARQGDFITKTTAVAPSETADCPTWLTFLTEATRGDAALIGFLQRWFGYCLTGDTSEQALIFFYGPGGNGKGVVMNSVFGIMGGYATNAAMDTFIASRGEKHTTDLAMLAGARLVMTTEVDEGQAWAEARIKILTGEDRITARFMRRDNFTFLPCFKLNISGNHKPTLRNVDDAVRRRLKIVPFLYKPKTADTTLTHRLKKEWPGILRWMIQGCLDWQNNGLNPPDVVQEATKEYFEAQNFFGRWLDECCILAIGLEVKPTLLLHSFQNWCRENGEEMNDNRRLRGLLEKTPGVRYRTVKGNQAVSGIGLKSQPSRRPEEGH
jgi:P4 family phage/plasmid primase-like protien